MAQTKMHPLLIWSTVLLVTLLNTLAPVWSGQNSVSTIKLSAFHVNVKKSIHTLNERFLSFTVDPETLLHVAECELTNGTVNMARSLFPAYLRIAGDKSNKLLFQEAPSTEPEKDSGFKSKDFPITGLQWLKLNDFISRTGLNVIVCLNGGTGNEISNLDLTNTLEFISFSNKHQLKLDWQLGYELQKNSKVDGKMLGYDVTRLRKMLDIFPWYQNSLIIGPDVTNLDNQELTFLKNYLSEASDSLNALTWHPFNDTQNEEDSDLLANGLNTIEGSLWSKDGLLKSSSRGVTPRKPIWIAESDIKGTTPNLTDSMIWLRRLGTAAKYGISVYLRKPHLLSLYEPTSEFWVSALYKALVGRTVLDMRQVSGNSTSKLSVFSHCTQINERSGEGIINPATTYEKGAVTVYGVNMESETSRLSFKVNLKGDEMVHLYVLTEDMSGNFPKTHLNHQALGLSSENELPILSPKVRKSPRYLVIPPKSIFFIVFPEARCRACMQQTLDETDSIQKQKIKQPEEENTESTSFSTNILEAIEEETDNNGEYVTYPKHPVKESLSVAADSESEAKPSATPATVKFVTFSEDTWLSSFPEKLKDVFNKAKSTPQGKKGSWRVDKYRTLADAMLGRRNLTDSTASGNDLLVDEADRGNMHRRSTKIGNRFGRSVMEEEDTPPLVPYSREYVPNKSNVLSRLYVFPLNEQNLPELMSLLRSNQFKQVRDLPVLNVIKYRKPEPVAFIADDIDDAEKEIVEKSGNDAEPEIIVTETEVVEAGRDSAAEVVDSDNGLEVVALDESGTNAEEVIVVKQPAIRTLITTLEKEVTTEKPRLVAAYTNMRLKRDTGNATGTTTTLEIEPLRELTKTPEPSSTTPPLSVISEAAPQEIDISSYSPEEEAKENRTLTELITELTNKTAEPTSTTAPPDLILESDNSTVLRQNRGVGIVESHHTSQQDKLGPVSPFPKNHAKSKPKRRTDHPEHSATHIEATPRAAAAAAVDDTQENPDTPELGSTISSTPSEGHLLSKPRVHPKHALGRTDYGFDDTTRPVSPTPVVHIRKHEPLKPALTPAQISDTYQKRVKELLDKHKIRLEELKQRMEKQSKESKDSHLHKRDIDIDDFFDWTKHAYKEVGRKVKGTWSDITGWFRSQDPLDRKKRQVSSVKPRLADHLKELREARKMRKHHEIPKHEVSGRFRRDVTVVQPHIHKSAHPKTNTAPTHKNPARTMKKQKEMKRNKRESAPVDSSKVEKSIPKSATVSEDAKKEHKSLWQRIKSLGRKKEKQHTETELKRTRRELSPPVKPRLSDRRKELKDARKTRKHHEAPVRTRREATAVEPHLKGKEIHKTAHQHKETTPVHKSHVHKLKKHNEKERQKRDIGAAKPTLQELKERARSRANQIRQTIRDKAEKIKLKVHHHNKREVMQTESIIPEMKSQDGTPLLGEPKVTPAANKPKPKPRVRQHKNRAPPKSGETNKRQRTLNLRPKREVDIEEPTEDTQPRKRSLTNNEIFDTELESEKEMLKNKELAGSAKINETAKKEKMVKVVSNLLLDDEEDDDDDDEDFHEKLPKEKPIEPVSVQNQVMPESPKDQSSEGQCRLQNYNVINYLVCVTRRFFRYAFARKQ